MCVRYFEGNLEGSSKINPTDWKSGLDLGELANELDDLVSRFEYSQALQTIWSQVLDRANRYIQNTEPFKLIKTDREACKQVLANLADAIRVTGILLKPFLPGTAETFYRSFNFEVSGSWDSLDFQQIANPPSGRPDYRVTAALEAGKPLPMFPKIQPSTES
jgi:methionyl-tRNA synthetase